MYELTETERTLIDSVKLLTGDHTSPDDQIHRFVKKYENDPSKFTKRNSKIRYLTSRKGFSLGELEHILGLPGGSISASAHVTNEKVNAYLSRLFDVPVDQLRIVPKTESVRSQLKKIAESLRNIATALDNI